MAPCSSPVLTDDGPMESATLPGTGDSGSAGVTTGVLPLRAPRPVANPGDTPPCCVCWGFTSGSESSDG